MNRSKLLLITILTVLLLGLKSWPAGLKAIRENNSSIKENSKSAGIHGPISIDGNEALATFIEDEGLSGDGTYTSPYIIENFIIIDARFAHGIEIRSTDAYLIIQNCTIEGGRYSRVGIRLHYATNVNISNNLLSNNYDGIYLHHSSNNTLSGNTASYNNEYGIYLGYSSNNNMLSGNMLYSSGLKIAYGCYDNDIDTSNKVNDKSVRYYENTPGVHLSGESDVGQVILVNCDESIIKGLNISETSIGITVYDSFNCSISENKIIDCLMGIDLESSSNNTLSGNNVSYNNGYGIYLGSSSNNNTLSGNNASYNNEDGILLQHSSNNNTLSGNNASYNKWTGIGLHGSSNNTLSENTANNNAYGIYLESSSNNTLSRNNASYNNGYGISLRSSSNNNILSGNNVSYNNGYGIALASSSNNNTLSGNTASYNNWYGIHLYSSSSNTLSGNTASYNNRSGIYLVSSNNNNILSGNTASYNNWYGIGLAWSFDNTLSGNTANNNKDGIHLHSSSYHTLFRNIISYNTDYGIYLSDSSTNNTIYFNDIYGNTNGQAFEEDDCSDNQWDNSITGNYWGGDYTSNYPSATNDGKIWSIPYEISGDGSGIDHFPLVNTIIIDIDYYRPQFTDIPDNFMIYEGYSDLSISWITTDLYPATYTIELNGIEVVSPTAWTNGSTISYNIPDGLLIGDHNVTIIVTDESGNTAQDTVIFTVISTKTTTTEGPTDDTTPTTTPSGNVLLLLLSFIVMFPLRRRKKKT